MENENILEEQNAEIPAEEIRQDQVQEPQAEKLDEGVKLAAGIMAAQDEDAESAAGEVLLEYPHIKLARRTVPQFSAECSGKGDGFAAIRNIFAKR